MRESFRAILETLGGTFNAPAGRGGGAGRAGGPADPGGAPTPIPAPVDDRPQLGAGGGIIHEVGCVRMGDDPRTSVLNRFCQAHDVANVFSADGGPFVSHGDKNPTHTIIALAWRTAEYLAEEMRKGHV
jgi:choline dehydrogenase-like flavoprotein